MGSDALPTILKTIISVKTKIVSERREQRSLDVLESLVEQADGVRSFYGALNERIAQQKAAVIAEVKRASPSKGIICENFDPKRAAMAYETNGAACLSVLTDEEFFKGSDEFLKRARESVQLPVLRKDFMIDPYQIVESRVLGADCILLIVAALSDEQLAEMYELSYQLGMDALVEVHTVEEYERAQRLNPKIIGVNNRNLHTFETSLEVTKTIFAQYHSSSEEQVFITESGIHTEADIESMVEAGVYGFLVGEAFMSKPEPGDALTQLFGTFL